MVADKKWDEQVLTKKETVSHDGNVWNPTDVAEAESTTGKTEKLPALQAIQFAI